MIPHPTLKSKNSFRSLNDLQPSRFALSYVPNPNRRAYWMEVAFMALDSEKLGEHVNDAYHLDFGDNMFPHFKGNKKTKSVFEEQDDDSGSKEDNEEGQARLNRRTLSDLKDFIPPSILEFLL